MAPISTHRKYWYWLAPLCLAGVGVVGLALAEDLKLDIHKNRVTPQWQIHDMKRPTPPIITPPTPSTQEQPGTPPSDATVLFDGKDLSHWKTQGKDEPAPWKVEDGAMIADKASIESKEPIGDCQLHVEWSTPTPPKGQSQGRGNSGVMLMGGRYEVQVLDSFGNVTYADGQAGAIYGQNPPLVNPARKPGEWQTYDILWHAPRFGADGKVTHPATVTVLYNGVYVQDHFTLSGPTGNHIQPPYARHAEKEPLVLQFHGNPTRFRNIWFRPLHEEDSTGRPDIGEQK